MTLLDDAMSYHERGFACIPGVVKKDGAKRPIVRWKPFQTRRPTDDELREWFTRPGVNGVAIIAGGVSGGLAIRDFDTEAGYRRWSETHPALAKSLPTVQTRRGRHVYCRSDLPRVVKLADGEYRGAGLSFAPHSAHPKGRYEWVISLPKGELPSVPHEVFTGTRISVENVAETAECHRETEDTETTEAISVSLSLCLSVSLSLCLSVSL